MKKCFVLLVVVFSIVVLLHSAEAVEGKTNKATGKKAKTAAVKTQPKAKGAVSKTAIPEAAASGLTEDKLADLKEETNLALKDLKGQLDQVKADNGDAKVGGVIFFQWSGYTQGNTAKVANSFDVTRAYIDIKKKLDWKASMRMTLDVARITGSPRQNLFDYLKYAYVDLPLDVSAVQVIPFSLTAKIGLQHTVWIDWADKILDLRYVAKSLVDNEGIMSSADFGLGATGKISLSGLPEIDYHATVLNGTGYATTESDKQKAIALRVNANVYEDPIGGIVVFGSFLNVETLYPNLSIGNGKQGGLEVAYKHELGAANLEYITGTKSSNRINGLSLGGVFNIGKALNFLPNLSLFIRQDNYDPNTAATNDDKKKSFYGVTYQYGKDIRLALDQQTSQTGNGVTTNILYLHSSIAF